MKHFLHTLIKRIEDAPLTLGSFLITFIGLIIVRLTVENALGLFPEHTFFFLFFEFTHTFLFFLCSLLLLLPLVRFAGRLSLREATNILLFGFLIIWTPPIIDTFVFQGGHFWSFYEFDGLRGLVVRFFTLFGDTPDIGITYGVRVEVVLVTLALGLYTYLKSQRFMRALLVALLTYTILFILGTFPSWITLGVLSLQKSLLSISSSDVAALFLSPEQVLGRDLTDFRSVLNFKMSLVYGLFALILSCYTFYQTRKDHFLALARNARLPQLIYHAGLLLLGILLGAYFANGRVSFEFFSIIGIFSLILATWCAWLASVVVNDIYDGTIDRLTNPDRPLVVGAIPLSEYQFYGVICFLFSLLLSGIVSFSAMLLLLAYQALATLYSAPPLRLKQYPGLATLIAALAGMLILIMGIVAIVPTHSITGIPLSLLAYLFLAYFLALPIKDFKDIEGDRRDHVYTLPVLLGAERGKYVIGSFLFLLFTLSPLVLALRSLLIPALLFGSLAYFVLQKGTANEHSFFAYRKLPQIILGITTLYGLVIVFFLI